MHWETQKKKSLFKYLQLIFVDTVKSASQRETWMRTEVTQHSGGRIEKSTEIRVEEGDKQGIKTGGAQKETWQIATCPSAS